METGVEGMCLGLFLCVFVFSCEHLQLLSVLLNLAVWDFKLLNNPIKIQLRDLQNSVSPLFGI